MAGSLPEAATPVWRRGAEVFDFAARGATITERFAATAKAAAASIAIVQGAQAASYAELDRRSNRLARYLQRCGVSAGDVVALRAGRSIRSLTAMLATLKLGAAYAPLDPAAPADYQAWQLQDCGARIVLVTGCGTRDLPVATFDLDEALAACEAEDDWALENVCRPEDIAYVMYTSGSTGRPKGVRVPHRGVVRLVADQTYARFAADEVLLHAAPLSFDASTFEIWGTLLHGARGVIVKDDRSSLHDLADTIARNAVTTAWFTAGLFHLLVEHQLDALKGLRQLLAGGDVLSPTSVLRAQMALPDCQIINGYGPTENTTFTCCYRVPAEGWGGGPVPIGTPINGTYVRLLDDAMNPVPDGKIGMLYTGGLGLASGYIGDACQSAASFVADPEQPGAVLYRTGDLARRRPDGALDFFGRRDRQVKIDGKRIEPGEIEEALRHDSCIADAVVTAARNSAGAPVLTAYLKPAAGAVDRATFASTARERLRGALPPHLQPSRFVVLDEFPLKPNGKVDYDRLPTPRVLPDASLALGSGDTEQKLLDIFSRLLGVKAVGSAANFFDLGATSLKLVEAHAAIEQLWPGTGVVALFRHPNVRELAQAIDGRGDDLKTAAQRRAQQQAAALRNIQRARSAR